MEASKNLGITKTDFMRGMQCPKMLWLDKHKPSLKVIPPEVQARLNAGNDFGDRAMGMFGPYEEMTVYRPGTTIYPLYSPLFGFSRQRYEYCSVSTRIPKLLPSSI